MEEISADLFPIQASNGEGPPELDSEDQLLLQMANGPLSASAARAYASRKYLMYFLIAVSFIGLPLAVFGSTYLAEIGFPRWIAKAGIAFTLAGYFVFFFAMLILVASRSKVLKQLGIKPLEHPGSGAAEDVAMLAKRHGRILEYGIDGTTNFWRHFARHPIFRIEYGNDGFYGSMGIPPAIRSLLESLPKNSRWRRLKIESGPEGLRTSRPIRLAKYFLHDLWLLEKVLNATAKDNRI